MKAKIGEENDSVYKGEWQDGLPKSKGVLVYPDGVTYDGQWQEGQPQCIGLKTKIDGSTYDEEWQFEEATGLGFKNLPNRLYLRINGSTANF